MHHGGLRLAYKHVLAGDQRGTEGQVLIAPGVVLADGRTLDLAVYGTLGNVVMAFDADSEELVWARQLGQPIANSRTLDGYLLNDQWGILGTGVIDTTTNIYYCVAWESPDGTPAKAAHFLYAVNLSDGSLVHPGCTFENITYTPPGGATQHFNSAIRKQRASLALHGTTVFVALGSVSETSHSSRGWLCAFDTEYQALTGAWCSTASAKGYGAGIWQAGASPAIDQDGFIYVMTGNGSYDGKTDWSESFVKLRYVRPARGEFVAIEVVDNWTGWTDDAQEGLDPTGADYDQLPPNPTPANVRSYTQAEDKGLDDLDLGSGGPSLDADTGILYGAGKHGVIYPVNAKKMGGTRPTDLLNPAANYRKLAAPPVFGTYYPGANVSPTPDDPRDLPPTYGGYTHHQHAEMCLVHLADRTLLLNGGENGNLRMWQVGANGSLTFLAKSAEWASWGCAGPPGGMPGIGLSAAISRSDPTTALILAVMPELDANQVISPGRLIVYSTAEIGEFPDGSKQLLPLWDSWNQNWQNQGLSHNKFLRAIAANGHVYLPTYSAEYWVLSLGG